MKNNEQIKTEVVNYLTKTSLHTFVKPNGTYFKVIKNGDKFQVLENDKLRDLNIDQSISWYGVNAKCVIKHHLFLNKGLVSVRKHKEVAEQMEKLQLLKK